MMHRVLAVIVTFNARQWLDRCLGSLVASEFRPDVLVIDNGSTDGTSDAVISYAQEHSDISLVLKEMNSNLGFASANNWGFEYALNENYDFVYLLNQDAWVAPDAIGHLVRASLGNPSFGVLSPLQMNPAMDMLDFNFAKYNMFVPSHIEVSPSCFFPAAHWLIPAAALRKVGAFSPSFHHYGEDDNWMDRLHFHGLKAGVVPDAKAVHDRQDRRRTKQQRCIAKCLIPVIRLSNPSFTALIWVIWAPLWLIGCSVKNFSLIPMRSIPSLLRNYPVLFKNRSASKSIGAFLTRSSSEDMA